jgi:curli production assembly/transport component CsgG
LEHLKATEMGRDLLKLLLICGIGLTGCAGMPSFTDSCTSLVMERIGECREGPVVVELPTYEKLFNLPAPEKQPIVAVYSFPDKTGQRKSAGGVAMFSTAVTQGAETMLIDALKTAGNGTWFRVVERVGIDHLTRERQIVSSTRKAYGEEDTTGLAPLLFAGIILEGGIIGFDTNIETGGHGARTLGVGASQAYRRDIVVVHLRAVSTLTGEVLLNVQTSKTILSVANGFDVFKFIDLDTQLIEIEDGMTENESVTRSLRSTIEAAVLELIYQGHDKQFWLIEDGHRNPAAGGDGPSQNEETINEK